MISLDFQWILVIVFWANLVVVMNEQHWKKNSEFIILMTKN